ncbi:MAG: hypothetical protein QOE69_1976 [Thermoleophilaceae bacterium]|jgi:hypothetical protein|nr:hypothetical protein [Thermoleophilaceae bacterium]MEA2407857.1 hypothetical protein [Thermoleophilaceae bacterium]
MAARSAHPYDDTDVIDARAPRTNQAVIGLLSLVAVLTGAEWLPAVLAAQLAIGLTLGRRYCLPCLLYFEVIQPRFGEGPIEDSRPPRFANMVGVAFLGAATIAFLAGAPAVGWTLTVIVAALALLAAITGFCAGCQVYRLTARLRGVAAKHVPRIDPDDVRLDGPGIVQFTHPLCSDCRDWERRLAAGHEAHAIVDVSERPELARKYGVSVVPTVVAVGPDGAVLKRLAP